MLAIRDALEAAVPVGVLLNSLRLRELLQGLHRLRLLDRLHGLPCRKLPGELRLLLWLRILSLRLRPRRVPLLRTLRWPSGLLQRIHRGNPADAANSARKSSTNCSENTRIELGACCQGIEQLCKIGFV